MKKFTAKIISLLLCVLIVCGVSACSLKEAFCTHEYIDTVITQPTCTEEGYELHECKKCGYAIERKIDPKGHDYGEWIETETPTCSKSGKMVRICKDCGAELSNPIIKAHEFGEWTTEKAATETETGLRCRVCKVCGVKDEEFLPKLYYVDKSVLTYEFKNDAIITNSDDLVLFFRAAEFNRITTAECYLYGGFEFDKDDFSQMFAASDANFAKAAKYRQSGNKIVFEIEYYDLPSVKTEVTADGERQTQYASLNEYKLGTPTRDDDYDDFKINEAEYEYPVTTSDQLYYCLERGVKPVPAKGSPAEEVYAKIKAVLRQILSDEMTEIQKVRAIHDYLVMNVTYDNVLLTESSDKTAEEVKKYNGFYLEGVFNDKIAVCDGISKAYAALLGVEGIPCVRVTGENKTPGAAGHAWNKVRITTGATSQWYVTDATSDNVLLNERQADGTTKQTAEFLSLAFFLTDDAAMKVNYKPAEHNDIVCDKKYVAQENDYFSSASILRRNFVIDNKLDAEAIINYVKTYSGSGTVTCQVYFKDSAKADEYFAGTGISLVKSGNYCTLIYKNN